MTEACRMSGGSIDDGEKESQAGRGIGVCGMGAGGEGLQFYIELS